MVLSLGEPLVRFWWCWFIHFYSSFCCCSSFISRLLCHVTGTPPWLLRPVKASTSSELYPDYFWLPLNFHLPWALLFFSGHFLPTSVFYLTLLHRHFSCVYQGLPGSQQFFHEVCRALYWSSKHRPGPSVCLIHSNPRSSYSEEFVFKFYQILSWITCGKKFSLSAPYSFRALYACSKYM